MKRWTRREIIAVLAAGVPSALALAALRPLLNHAGQDVVALPPAGYPTPSLAPSAYRNTAGGTVVSVATDQLVVDSGNAGSVQIFLDDATLRDDGLWTAALPISPGDNAIATGEPYKGGLQAEKIWINAANYIGEVLEVYDGATQAPFRFRMRDRYDLTPYHDQHPEGHAVFIDPRTLAVGPLTPGAMISGLQRLTPVGQQRIELRVGQVIQATGHEYQGVLQCVSLFLS